MNKPKGHGHSLQLVRMPDQTVQTMGKFVVYDMHGFPFWKCSTLELPWKNNRKSVSCISDGIYPVELHNSPKYGKCFWVKDVENRSEILIHPANFVGSLNPRTGRPDLRGCIAPGLRFQDITNDGIKEVLESRKAMDKLLYLMADEFELTITSNLDV